MMCDSQGVIHEDRDPKVNKYKAPFAENKVTNPADALKGRLLYRLECCQCGN